MAQFARPDSNVTQTSFTNGFSNIDEAVASDADFAYGANNTAAELEVGLSNVGDPNSSSNHTFRYRIAKTNAGTVDGGGNAVTVTARLRQGTTQIAVDTARTATGTWTEYSYTLTSGEADSITDYTDLRLEFVTSASGGSPANRRGGAVSWAELEVPDVSVSAGLASGTGAANLGSGSVSPSVGLGSGSGTAYNAAGSPGTLPNAGHAAGTGTAYDATVDVDSGAVWGPWSETYSNVISNSVLAEAAHAAGTGSANAAYADIAPNAESSAGTGASGDVDPAIGVYPGVAPGTGAAYDATVSAVTNTNANAEHAAGTGSAADTDPAIGVYPGAATGTGTAYNATVDLPIANAGHASGTGVAYGATVSTSTGGELPPQVILII